MTIKETLMKMAESDKSLCFVCIDFGTRIYISYCDQDVVVVPLNFADMEIHIRGQRVDARHHDRIHRSSSVLQLFLKDGDVFSYDFCSQYHRFNDL